MALVSVDLRRRLLAALGRIGVSILAFLVLAVLLRQVLWLDSLTAHARWGSVLLLVISLYLLVQLLGVTHAGPLADWLQKTCNAKRIPACCWPALISYAVGGSALLVGLFAQRGDFTLPRPIAVPWTMFSLLCTMVVGPLAIEEPLVRGFLQKGLSESLGPASAIVIASVLYGLTYWGQDPVRATVLGLLLAAITWAVGTVRASLVVAAVWRALLLLEQSSLRPILIPPRMRGPVVAAGAILTLLSLLWITRRLAGERDAQSLAGERDAQSTALLERPVGNRRLAPLLLVGGLAIGATLWFVHGGDSDQPRFAPGLIAIRTFSLNRTPEKSQQADATDRAIFYSPGAAIVNGADFLRERSRIEVRRFDDGDHVWLALELSEGGAAKLDAWFRENLGSAFAVFVAGELRGTPTFLEPLRGSTLYVPMESIDEANGVLRRLHARSAELSDGSQNGTR